jgi:hypothetical protein
MKVLERINARKIVLGFFYQYLFFDKLQKDERMMKEILAIANIFPTQEGFMDEELKFSQLLVDCRDLDSDEELDYAIIHFFDKWRAEDIDMDYVFAMGK